MRTSGHHRSLAGLGGVGALLLLAGCGSGSQPSDFCKAVDSLDAAITQINQTSLTKSSVTAVQESVATIDKAVKNVSKTVQAAYASDVDAIKAASDELDTSVATAVQSPTPDHLAAARAAMKDLTGAVDDLAQSTSSSC